MGNLRMNADQISYKGGEKPMSVEEAIKNAGNTGLAHTADIAPDFSTESAYSAGDYVYHNGTLYVFTSNHAAGAWSTSDTQAVTVGGEISTLTGETADLYSVKANQITIAPFFSENTAYDPGDLVYYNGLSYRCVNSHEGAWDADDFAATTIANELDDLKSGLTGKLNFAAHAMEGSATLNIYHYSMVIVMSDRGGLYFDGTSNRGLQALVASESVTVTHVDGTNLTVKNNSQYGTNIIVLSDGDITISPVS